MARRNQATFAKRQRESDKRAKRQEKATKRAERRAERIDGGGDGTRPADLDAPLDRGPALEPDAIPAAPSPAAAATTVPAPRD